MNIVRTSLKEYGLEFFLHDSNIKTKNDYKDSEELDKNRILELNQEFYIEWEMYNSKRNDFFTTLSFFAENGFFEKDNIEEIKNILENNNIPPNQKFLKEKLINKEYSGDVLDILDDIYIENESRKIKAYFFRSRITSNNNGRDIIFKVALDKEEQITLSAFFILQKIFLMADREYYQWLTIP